MKFWKVSKVDMFTKIKIQDFVVVFSLFLFSSILVLGLFPRGTGNDEAGRLFFIYTMMSIPVIVAIYFIIITFRRKISKDRSFIDTSIKTKMTLAFLFVAIIPSLPIVIISNNLINRAIAEMFSTDTTNALEQAINMSEDNVGEISETMRNDLKFIKYSLDNRIFRIANRRDREHITSIFRQKGEIFKCYYVVQSNGLKNVISPLPGDAGSLNYSEGVEEYLSLRDYDDQMFVSKIFLKKMSLLVGGYYFKPYLIAFYRIIPEKFYQRVNYFHSAKKRYDKKIFLRPYIQTISGLLLIVLSITVVVFSIGVSIFLSKNITKPILELEDGARKVSSGDFTIRLYRNASDELTLLYNSFNTMVRQLNESRKAMYHMQKIRAWGEVGNKLLHEIKNPLTPIRLSAERIRKRFLEKNKNIENVILEGTDTIIEEINTLHHILGEFRQFARLPRVKLKIQNINKVIDNCLKSFYGHEKMDFRCKYNEEIPDIPFDKNLIRQALVNIIKNAVEAVNENGEIDILTDRSDNEKIIIKVHDNGPGISEDNLDKLFEPTFSLKKDGSGLGLAIVERIIMEHKGKIYCKSEAGAGTTFTIELPIKNESNKDGII